MHKSKKKRKLSSSGKPTHPKQKQVQYPGGSTRQDQPPAPTKKEKHNSNAPGNSKTIPFKATDSILLIGEGDFSFAHSLLTHHHCRHITATSYDSRLEVLSKYSQAKDHIERLVAEGQKVVYGVDGMKLSTFRGQLDAGRKRRRRVKKKKDRDSEDGKMDARPGWDKIVFNFPHVGGKSTDVNRQVRYNQELLVSFFKSSMPLLNQNPGSGGGGGGGGGVIIVTIFEGEPYTLWNIRDLARHVGLKVVRSFKFRSGDYPGYKHARTLGNVCGGGGWKGEERDARSFIFEIDGVGLNESGLGGRLRGQKGNKRKRERGNVGSSDDDDDDDNDHDDHDATDANDENDHEESEGDAREEDIR